MYRFLETLFKIAALMIAEGWFLQGYFAHRPEWDSALAVLAALSVVLLSDPVKAIIRQPSFQHDEDLYSKFLDDFPSNGSSVRLLKEQDFGNPFKSSDLDQVDKFANNWSNAEHEFQLRPLERKRQLLLTAVKNFSHELAVNVFPCSTLGILTMDLKDCGNQPERLSKRDEINKLALAVYEAHQGLIKTANKALRKEV